VYAKSVGDRDSGWSFHTISLAMRFSDRRRGRFQHHRRAGGLLAEPAGRQQHAFLNPACGSTLTGTQNDPPAEYPGMPSR
jgi:hypothetical protein